MDVSLLRDYSKVMQSHLPSQIIWDPLKFMINVFPAESKKDTFEKRNRMLRFESSGGFETMAKNRISLNSHNSSSNLFVLRKSFGGSMGPTRSFDGGSLKRESKGSFFGLERKPSIRSRTSSINNKRSSTTSAISNINSIGNSDKGLINYKKSNKIARKSMDVQAYFAKSRTFGVNHLRETSNNKKRKDNKIYPLFKPN